MRIFVFVFIFVVFCGLFVLAIANQGLQAAAGFADPGAARQAMSTSIYKLMYENWPLAVAGITLVSALLAFGAHLRTWFIAGCAATGIFFYFRVAANYQYAHQNAFRHPRAAPTPVAAPLAPPPPPAALAMTPQKRAVQLFPDLGVTGSRLNREFLRRFTQYQKDNPSYFNNPEWPTQLARESDAAIRF